GPWKDDRKNYYHRSYYFKVTPTDKEYQHHEVIFFKKARDHYYYWNRDASKFWGRGLVASVGEREERFQLLPRDRHAGGLKDIDFAPQPVGAPPLLSELAGGAPLPPPPAFPKGAARLKLPPDKPLEPLGLSPGDEVPKP